MYFLLRQKVQTNVHSYLTPAHLYTTDREKMALSIVESYSDKEDRRSLAGKVNVLSLSQIMS